MIIFVPKINVLNFPIFYLLSFIYEVKTYEMQPILSRFRRIKLLNLSHYFNWEKYMVVRSEVVNILEELLPSIPTSIWNVKIKNRTLDLTIKAKKDLQKEIENAVFLKNILNFYKKENVRVIYSLKTRFLLHTTKPHELFSYRTIGSLSTINVLLDRFNFMLLNLCILGKTIYQFILGVLCNRNTKRKINYIYDGDTPKALSTSSERNTFTWLIDNKIVRKSDILFLLPRAGTRMEKHAKDYLKDKELFAIPIFSMLKLASRKSLFSCAAEIMKIFTRIFMPIFSLNRLLCIRYSLAILRWIPLVESLSPKVYIYTFSNVAIENPAILYFNKIGVKTIAWPFSTSTGRFLKEKTPSTLKQRSRIYCNIMSDTVIVWNHHFKEFLEEHPQANVKIEIMGPLMSGNENVMNAKREYLLQKMGILHKDKMRYITVFDKAQIWRRIHTASSPVNMPPEYNYAFVKDICCLLDEFQDLTVIFKPKRDLMAGMGSYPDEVKAFFLKMKENPRIIILDSDINPWTPIALADMCIGLPFGSANIAALHYKKPMIFHDPWNVARYHRYSKLEPLITHDFSQLKNRAEKFLFEPNAFKNIYDKMDVSDFTGVMAGTNSSSRFRELLKNSAEKKY